MTARLKSLSKAKKIILGTGAFILLMSIISPGTEPPKKEDLASQNTNTSAQVKGDSTETTNRDEPKQPVIETKLVEQTLAIPYTSVTRNDSSLPKGQKSTAPGINGEKVITFKVTYTDGKETAREVASEKVTKQPTNEVVTIGTKVAEQPRTDCNPNYAGCVPNASDVDCADGSGNGPAFVRGPIKVTGSDVYKLDRDHDGLACE